MLPNHVKTVADSGLYCGISMRFVQSRQYSVEVKVFLKYRDVAERKCRGPANKRVFVPQENEAIVLCPSPVFFVPRSAVEGSSYSL
jgi:hypothetical protein